MIQFVQINLLPYREEIVQQKKKAFQTRILLFAILGLVAAGAGYMVLDGLVTQQKDRNTLLTKEVDILNKEIKEVAGMKQQRDEFLARKKKIEELQSERFLAAKIFDDLSRLTPEGVYLSSVSGSGPKGATVYNLTGKALTDSKVAMFMNSLESTGVFGTPELLGIRKTDDTQEFTLTVKVLSQVAQISDVAEKK